MVVDADGYQVHDAYRWILYLVLNELHKSHVKLNEIDVITL